jgi:hypothetical protein
MADVLVMQAHLQSILAKYKIDYKVNSNWVIVFSFKTRNTWAS